MVNDLPWYKMFPDAWDIDLEDHPLEIEGAWIRICNKLWRSETRGKLIKTIEQWARILRIPIDDTDRILHYIQAQKIGDIKFGHGRVTIISRRQIREEKARQEAAERQRRSRKGDESQDGHKAVTKESRTRGYISKEDRKEYTPAFESFWEAYPRKIEKKRAYKIWKTRIKEGHTAEEMTEAAKRYAKKCEKTEETYIKYASTFIGPDKPFLERIEKQGGAPSLDNQLQATRCMSEHPTMSECPAYIAGEDTTGFCADCSYWTAVTEKRGR